MDKPWSSSTRVFSDVSEGVFPLATSAQVLDKDVIAGEQAEDALEVLGVAAAVGTDAVQNLGCGEGSVRTILPYGLGDFKVNDSNEGHRDTHHVG
ncbi:hypothetical protein E2542_SST02597 [Spatholobus suberectus]|nr:hypothetical protein E2542_SST02597 [Spatholobus suberectus]